METHQTYGSDVTFLGVAGLDTTDAMDDFVATYGVGGFDHLVDDTGGLWERFGVPYQPAWVFIDDDGTVTRHLGPLFGDDLGRRLDDLLAT